MIEVKNNSTKISGERLSLLAEITVVMHIFIQQNIADKEMLESCLEIADESNEEIDAECEALNTKKSKEILLQKLNEFFEETRKNMKGKENE